MSTMAKLIDMNGIVNDFAAAQLAAVKASEAASPPLPTPGAGVCEAPAPDPEIDQRANFALLGFCAGCVFCNAALLVAWLVMR